MLTLSLITELSEEKVLKQEAVIIEQSFITCDSRWAWSDESLDNLGLVTVGKCVLIIS